MCIIMFFCVITGPVDYDIMKCAECVLGMHSSADWFPRRVASQFVFAACCTFVRVPRDNNAYHAIPIRVYRGAYGRRESCARELTDRK